MHQFREETPGVVMFRLAVNYRCSVAVVKMCNEVISEMRKRYVIYADKPAMVGSSTEEGIASAHTFDTMVPEGKGLSEIEWVCQ